MKPKAIKVAATAAVFVLALSGLLYSTLSEGTEYYKHVDEVMGQPEAWHDKQMNLHGFVVEKSIMRRPDSLEYRFTVQNNGKVVPVSYTGVVPDTFKDGSEVVLKGRLGPHGFKVDPNGVIAKCPSKYEEQKLKRPVSGA
jgi:cytochrome c-type biogenesis protein CcmE